MEQLMANDATYIAGPMSPGSFGLTETPEDWDWNHPAFHQMAEIYRAAGHNVVNPAELDSEVGTGQPWDTYLRRDLVALSKCDHIVMLPGWEGSKGARLEHHVAVELGFEVTYMEAR